MVKSIKIRSKGAINDLFFIISAAAILRILPALFGSSQNMDMILFRAQALPILNNQNIYQVTHKIFPYSPLSMFIPALCLLASNISNIPFHITMKIPAIMGDVSLSIAIYYWVMRVKNDADIALKAALLYVVNPLAILISGFQGNMMSIPALFTFLAIMLAIYDQDKNYRLSALLFGLAVAFRGYPILLLPLILIKSRISTFKKLKYIAYAIIPAIILFIPFLLINHKALFKEIFGYSGFFDYGLVAMERARALYYFLVSNCISSTSSTLKEHLYFLHLLPTIHYLLFHIIYNSYQ